MKARHLQTDRSREGNGSEEPVVLVGTYREVNADWIRERKCYNLPLPDGLDAADEKALAFHRRFTHVVLYSHDHAPIVRRVHFAKVVGQGELTGSGYKPPKPPFALRSGRYALYEFTEKAAASRLLSDPRADVFVVSSRCPSGLKIDADFYAKPLPDVGGKSIPNVFEKLRPYFRKWHSAVAFNPVQLDFFASLGGDEVPFPAPNEGKFTFIDLFAGIGGIRLGYQLQGGKCVFSSEWDAAAAKTYCANFGEQPFGDIQKIAPEDIPDFDILLAGFPCQPFSIIGDREGFNHETQGTLFFNIEKILLAKKPKAFMLENVRNLMAHDGGRTFKVILAHLKKAGYDVHFKVLNALDYGVPQKRERIIICGFRKAVDFEFPPPIPVEERKTVADIIDSDAEKDKTLFVRAAIRESRLRRLRDKEFPRPYISHENVAGSITPHAYSCALRAGASANYILVNDERRPSAREMLRIQGFPDEFKIVVNYGQIKHQTGNSVAVPVIKAVAERVVAKLAEL